MKRRLVHLAIGLPLALLPLVVLPFLAFASIPDSIQQYGASAKAAALRFYAYDTETQFATVDSSFPLAYSTQAGGGGLGYSDATSTYFDYGPVGVVALGVPDGQGPPFNMTGLGPGWIPDAHATYPGSPQQSTLYPGQCPAPTLNPPYAPCPDFGKAGPPPANGPYATAQADESGSHAFATLAGAAGGGWPLLTSQTKSVVNSDGSITTTAHAYLAEAVIGPFTFQKIDVTSVVSSAGGTGKVDQSRVAIGSVQANGNTVELTDKGLTIGPVATTQPISLNGTQAAGFVTYTAQLVAPQQTLNGPEATLVNTGVKVTAVEQDPQLGNVVTEEYDLGYASVDASLTPSTSTSFGGLSGGFPGGLASLSGTGTLAAGNFPSAIQQAPAAKAAPAPRLFVPVASRKPLAMAFLGWEALVMCGVAAWVWARKTVVAA